MFDFYLLHLSLASFILYATLSLGVVQGILSEYTLIAESALHGAEVSLSLS